MKNSTEEIQSYKIEIENLREESRLVKESVSELKGKMEELVVQKDKS